VGLADFAALSATSIIMISVDDNRLAISTRFGATAGMNSSDGNVPKVNVTPA
jgi:Zn-dependent alcohol dehydrogenase